MATNNIQLQDNVKVKWNKLNCLINAPQLPCLSKLSGAVEFGSTIARLASEQKHRRIFKNFRIH